MARAKLSFTTDDVWLPFMTSFPLTSAPAAGVIQPRGAFGARKSLFVLRLFLEAGDVMEEEDPLEMRLDVIVVGALERKGKGSEWADKVGDVTDELFLFSIDSKK